jgi:folate-binding protein YgfZ
MAARLFDLSDWSQIEITGRDRQSLLHGFCTNDIKRLAPGEGCEAFIANIKGRVIGHIEVFAEEGRLALESEPGQAAAVIAHLDKYVIGEDVQLTDRSRDWGLLLIAGDEAGASLQAAGLCESPPDGIGDHVELTYPGGAEGRVSIRRNDRVGGACWTISANAAAIPPIHAKLVDAGATPGDRNAFESLRIEHGYPLFGVDLTESNLVQESARVRQTVSFAKGCYLGQEPIARLDALGHVNRQLCRLRFKSSIEVAAGTKVLDASAAEVGHITSAAPILSSPDRSDWAAIALVRREFAAPGSNLLVQVGDNVTADAVAIGAE